MDRSRLFIPPGWGGARYHHYPEHLERDRPQLRALCEQKCPGRRPHGRAQTRGLVLPRMMSADFTGPSLESEPGPRAFKVSSPADLPLEE